MSRKNVVLLIVALSVVFITTATVLYKHWAYQQEVERFSLGIAQGRAQIHVMSVENSLRLHRISLSTQESGKLSDKDFNWMLTLAQSPMPTANAEARVLLRSEVVAYINEAKALTDSQSKRLYDFGLPLLKSTDTLDKITGIEIMVAVHKRQAVSYIQPLLSDTDNIVRVRAREAIEKLSKSA